MLYINCEVTLKNAQSTFSMSNVTYNGVKRREPTKAPIALMQHAIPQRRDIKPYSINEWNILKITYITASNREDFRLV